MDGNDKKTENETEDNFLSRSKARKARLVNKSDGIVKFDRYEFVPTEFDKQQAMPASTEFEFGWQSISQLDLFHAEGLAFGIIGDRKLGPLNFKPREEIISEIEQKLSEEDCRLFNEKMKKLHHRSPEGGLADGFVDAVWADLYAEKFGLVWLAAMSLYANFIENDHFAVGYFTALIDQKQNNEEHFLRGKKTVASAKAGGEARGADIKAKRDEIIKAMQDYIDDNHSISRAAELTFKRGLGTSKDANKKIWHRRVK